MPDLIANNQVNPIVRAAAEAYVSNGIVPDKKSGVFARRHRFFHRVDYVAAGQGTLTFFNVGYTRWVCNLPQAGYLPNNMAFVVEAVHLKPQTGITSAATFTRAAGGAQSNMTAAPAVNTGPAFNFEEIRTILEGGLVNFQVGERKLIADCYGCENLPAGSGLQAMPAVATNSATAVNTLVVPFNNGAPIPNLGWVVTPKYEFYSDSQIQLTIDWQAALAVTTAFVIKAEIEGVLISTGT